MAVVDPYAPCPCGSQQKYKWCCHKAEAAALRVERLIQGEQLDQAMKAVEDGLQKHPGNAWLLLQKEFLHERADEPKEALATIAEVLRRQPDHIGALAQRVQLTLAAEGPVQGAAELQAALSACKDEDRPLLAGAFRVVGVFLARADQLAAAIAHLEIAAAAEPEEDSMSRSGLRAILNDPTVSPWLKHPYDLSDPPEGLDDEARARFEEAIRDADEALWARAASRFETLSADGVAGADLNLGLCRLWMADDRGAVEALRRHLRGLGTSTEAVDLEALCQIVEPPPDDFAVEHVQLTWPLLDRDGLLSALRDAERTSRTVASEGSAPADPDDPESPEAEVFALVDRPLPEAGSGLTAGQLPRLRGRVIVGERAVSLQGYDDGKKLDALRDRFLELAGATVPQAHPKTTVLGVISRVSLALRNEWILPEGTDRDELDRLLDAERVRGLSETWPETPMPFLGGRTPRQAARDGDAEVPLRAAACLLEAGRSQPGFDWDAFRAGLGIPPEPVPDPESVDIDAEHLGRLHRIPADRLDDEPLWALYRRARSMTLPLALERAARELISRPTLLSGRSPSERFTVFADLAQMALGRGQRAEALGWVERGRRDEPAAHKAENAPRWDFLAIRLRSRSEPPESWVAELAVVMERYREDRNASGTVMSNLLEMGLVRLAPHPEQPDQVMLDTRPLMAVLAQYGPRVTTASGGLGVSAARPDIWTPDRAAGSPGGIWTPGSGQAPAPGGEKKIIFPG